MRVAIILLLLTCLTACQNQVDEPLVTQESNIIAKEDSVEDQSEGRSADLLVNQTDEQAEAQVSEDSIVSDELMNQPDDTGQIIEAELPVSRPSGQILFSSERDGDRDLYLLDILSGKETCILDLDSIEGHGDFCSDGYRIVFFSTMHGDRELYTIDLRDETLEPIRLTDMSGKDHLPDWSPDGKRIVFESTRDGNAEIYLMNADGTHQRRLTDYSEQDRQPKFSPDGTRIYFTRYDKGKQKLAYMEIDQILDSDQIPEVFLHEEAGLGYVDIAADGKTLAYHGTKNGRTQIFIDDMELGASLCLTTDSGFTYWIPVFSPDGHWIAFNKEKGFGSGDLYLKHLATGQEFQLTDDPSSDWGPDFRPQSNFGILFDSNRDGDRDLYVYNSMSKETRALTDNEWKDGIPCPSKDGSKILFFSDRDGDDEIFVMDADGSNVVQLTDNEAVDRAAVWAEGGDYIVFCSDRDGDMDIFKMRSDGTNQVQLTDNDIKDFWPEVSPDGTEIFYTQISSTQDTYRIAMDDWEQEERFEAEMVMENCSRASFSEDGSKIAFSTKVDGSWQIAVASTDSFEVNQLTHNYHSEWVPTWLDDETLVFSREFGYKAAIVKIDINTGFEQYMMDAESQNWRPIIIH